VQSNSKVNDFPFIQRQLSVIIAVLLTFNLERPGINGKSSAQGVTAVMAPGWGF
jgi:hypothetical protein